MNLRQITIKDQLELKKVYFDSIQSLDIVKSKKEHGVPKRGIIQILIIQ